MKYHSLAILIPRLWYSGIIHKVFTQLTQNQKPNKAGATFSLTGTLMLIPLFHFSTDGTNPIDFTSTIFFNQQD
jgi:hypothetical protein